MVGVRETALKIDCFARSSRVAISTSPSRVSSGIVPI